LLGTADADPCLTPSRQRPQAPLFGKRSDLLLSIGDEDRAASGPSAGACAALATTVTLEGAVLMGNVAVTGTIDLLGDVGPIGDMQAKMRGCMLVGATRLLAPAVNVAELAKQDRLSQDEEEDKRLRAYLEKSVVGVQTFIDVLEHAVKGR
jgi:PDZ domain-containing secreted protein